MRDFFGTIKSKSIPWIVVGLFFASYLVIGLRIYRDYGLSWDELYERKSGIQTGEYILGKNQDLLVSNDRYYGQFFNLFKLVVEQINPSLDFPEVLLLGHLINFLLFYLAAFVFFLFGVRRWGDWKPGLLGSAFLIFSPVIFSHSFFNPKDIPFLAFIIFAMYTYDLTDERFSFGNICLHAVFSSAAIGSRILGVFVPVITLALFFLRQAFGPVNERLPRRKLVALMGTYAVLTVAGTILLYPVFWKDPLDQFLQAFTIFQHYTEWNSSMVFMGQVITQENIPWYYLPVWIAISTPLLYLVAFIIGTIAFLYGLMESPRLVITRQKRSLLLAQMWFFIPLTTIIIGRSIVYDGWRHVYFIYPALLLIAIDGLLWVNKWFRSRWNSKVSLVVSGLAVIISLSLTCLHVVRTHPHELIYFNFLAGPDLAAIQKDYELDYWGLTFREALEFIHLNDSSEHIRVTTSSRAGEFNELIISKEANLKLEFVDDARYANYYVTNIPGDIPTLEQAEEVYAVLVDGVKICVVYHLPNPLD